NPRPATIAVFNWVKRKFSDARRAILFTAEHAEIAEIRYQISACSAPSAVKSFISDRILVQAARVLIQQRAIRYEPSVSVDHSAASTSWLRVQQPSIHKFWCRRGSNRNARPSDAGAD